MAYRLKRSRPLEQEVRRIAVEQIDRALKRLGNGGEPAAAVHETRKHLKRVRALLRLVRPALPDGVYRQENVRLRDIGRTLSGARDLHVLGETLAGLEARHPVAAAGPCRHVGAHIAARRAEADAAASAPAIQDAIRALGTARRALKRIRLADARFEALAAGLEATYRRCRSAHAEALSSGTDESYHELRKRVQQHWRQLALLAPAWPALIKARTQAARALSDMLGRDQDLARLAAFVSAAGDDVVDAGDRRIILGLVADWQKELREQAEPDFRRVLAEKPRQLARTMQMLWETSGRDAPEEGAGEADAPAERPAQASGRGSRKAARSRSKPLPPRSRRRTTAPGAA